MEVQLALIGVMHGAAAVALGMAVVLRLRQVLPYAASIEGDLRDGRPSCMRQSPMTDWRDRRPSKACQ
jgi:hypothetical protein